MNPQVAPFRPFRPDETRLVVRGQVQVRLRPDRAPDTIPSHAEVMSGRQPAATALGVSRPDRVVRAHSAGVRVTRTFGAAGRRWDDLEEGLGLSRTFRVELDPDASLLAVVDSLRELDDVEAAAPVYLTQAPFSFGARSAPGDRSTFDRVGATEARALEPGDRAVIVAVIDSGVALAHPELRHALRPGADLVDLSTTRLSRGLRLVGDSTRRDRDASDEQGHGTGCASILVARGLELPPGLAGDCPLLPVRALARAQKAELGEPTAVGSIADIDAAVKLAVDLGARVLNLSFGTPERALLRDDPRCRTRRSSRTRSAAAACWSPPPATSATTPATTRPRCRA